MTFRTSLAAVGVAIVTIINLSAVFAPSRLAAQGVTVLTGNDYPPFADETLPEGGLATDVVRRAFDRMGQPLEILYRPWERGMVETQAGKYLATFPWSYNEERAQSLAYSEPLYTFSQYYFTQRDSGFRGISDADLAGARFCLALSYNTSGLDRLVEAGVITLVRPQTLSNCFQMIAAGRADVVRVNDRIAWQTIAKLGLDPELFHQIEEPARTSVQHVLFSRAHPDSPRLLEAFNAALTEMKADGSIDDIMAKHLK